jgi:ADP-heptose:LPS heptosyltransferase
MDAPYTERLRSKWLLICQRAPANWRADHTERIRQTRDARVFATLEGLLDCAGSIRFKKFGDESVVEMTLQYLREKMHLREVAKTPPLTPPAGLTHRRFRQRVVVCPDSAGPEQKNWTPKSFIRLCEALAARGYTPEIVVAPKNHARWANMRGNRYATPCFPDIGKLCAYLYESGVVVANDSGNGHLASFLDVPVVTIYRKKNPNFHWRPDWGRGIVVCPTLTLPWISGPLWKPFVSMAKILSAVGELC